MSGRSTGGMNNQIGHRLAFLKLSMLIGCVALGGAVAICCFVLSNPTRMWKSGIVELQEMAMPRLKSQLRIGMTKNDVTRIMGGLPHGGAGVKQWNGSVLYSYNVNSWYNRGLDLTFHNDRLVEIFEYD